MRLNLAHGLHPTTMPGWLNVDLPWHGVRGADVYADAFRLPFPAASFERAYVGHFLEHIEWDDIPAVLAELRRVLHPGAQVMFVGPDYDAAIATGQPQWLLDDIATLKEGPGGHKWCATADNTREAIERGGFVGMLAWPIEAVTPQNGWPNPDTAPWQCAVFAQSPLTP